MQSPFSTSGDNKAAQAKSDAKQNARVSAQELDTAEYNKTADNNRSKIPR